MSPSDHTSPASPPACAADAKRAGYISGLRRLADVLEASPAVPLPYDGTTLSISLYYSEHDSRQAEFIEIVRALGPVDWQEKVKSSGAYGYDLVGKLDGLLINVAAHLDAVCTKRVVGIDRIGGQDVPVTEWVTPLAEILAPAGGAS